MVHRFGALGHLLPLLFLGTLAGLNCRAETDPSFRVARLNYIDGAVSMQPAGIDEWAAAEINHPFTTGDYLYTDQRAVAELHLDTATLRMGQYTTFGFLNLTDEMAQLRVSEGDLYFRIHDFGPNQVMEVDTPNAAITLLRNGVYRIHVDPNAVSTYIAVREGEAEIAGGGQAFTLRAGSGAALSGTTDLAYDVEQVVAPDVFDNWCAQRDAHELSLQSARYLPPTLIGSEDLDAQGVWSEMPDYGPVWYPRAVPVDWAPYHSGHWVWVEPWGWTWVDSAPWGFAPFHYGRWIYLHQRWGWAPGPLAVRGYAGPVIRPVYAPAMVAWFGGPHWGVSISSGGPSVGWVPLGWGEVYTPAYACSRPYFERVNVTNTRIIRTVNITNVYNTVYVNRSVYNQQFVNEAAPHAVSAMPGNAFASGRPVGQAGIAVRSTDVGRLHGGAVLSPPVSPTRQAVSPELGRAAVRPPAAIQNRPVIARAQPGLSPVSFAARQALLEKNAGQIHNFAAIHEQTARTGPSPSSSVVLTRAVQPVAAQPGMRINNAQARYEPLPSANNPSINQPTNVSPGSRPTGNVVPPSQRAAEPMQTGQQPPAGVRQPGPIHGTPPNLHNGTQQPSSAERERAGPRPSARAPATNVPRAATPQPAERVQPTLAQQEKPQGREENSNRHAAEVDRQRSDRPNTATQTQQPSTRMESPAAPSRSAHPETEHREGVQHRDAPESRNTVASPHVTPPPPNSHSDTSKNNKK